MVLPRFSHALLSPAFPRHPVCKAQQLRFYHIPSARIGNSDAILPMTTVASAGAYLLSTPVEFGPNAAPQSGPDAGATQEWTLAGVGCRRLFGWGCPTPRRQTSLAPPGCHSATLSSAPAPSYLSTSSARKRSIGEIVSPRTWAVLRFTTSSNLSGRSTGRS